jgi:glutamate-1-semialdehyde 2,1-aminomutase
MTNPEAAAAFQGYEGSRRLLERARRVIPGGVSSAFRAKSVPVPLYFERAQGSRMWDVDGNEYLDYTLAWGPLILGHAHPRITEAVEAALRRGWLYGAQHELEIRVAERLVELIPCAERVVFSNTGTEAAQIAFRLARGFTRRSRILRFNGHYHGWIEPRPDTLLVPWNDLWSFEQTLAQHHDEIAAVILEPILCNGGCILPAPGFLESVRAITRQHGVVLIFDEVITGFRVHLNGAQGWSRVTPDLATFGKAVAGGLPLSVVAGGADILRLIEDGTVLHGGSFNSNPVVLAAAEATLAELSRDDGAALEGVRQFGERLMAGLSAAAEKVGLSLEIRGVGSVFKLVFSDEDAPADARGLVQSSEGLLRTWLEAARGQGLNLLPDGRWYVSTVHTESDLAETLQAAGRAFDRAASKPAAR